MVPIRYPNILFSHAGRATPIMFNGEYIKRIAVIVLFEKINLSIDIMLQQIIFNAANEMRVV